MPGLSRTVRRVVSCSDRRTNSLLPRPTSRSVATVAASTHDLAVPTGCARLSSRRLISVAGRDATKYLQGVVTSDIARKGSSQYWPGGYAAFLNAQGRVLHDVFIYTDTNHDRNGASTEGDAFLIEVDAREVETLFKHIKRYKLRANFKFRILDPDEVIVSHVWGTARAAADEASAQLREIPHILLQDPRAPGLGTRVLHEGSSGGSEILRTALGVPEVDEMAYKVRRYLYGVAEGQTELSREHSLPQESNMDVMHGIDFHKGCYVGQELTIRTKHRGVVRKRVLPCMIYSEDEPMPPALEYSPTASTDASLVPRETSIGRANKKGRSAGKWLAGVGNVGLGLCRLEMMTDIVLPGESTSTCKPEDEFKLEWVDESDGSDKKVKIKAFVPEWLRNGLAGQ